MAVIAPPIAERRSVVLPAGRVVLRDFAGPLGAPTVVLLHGLGVTADINFFRCYGPLAERYRVLAFDHRGHGEGVRSRRPFRLSDCADDVVAMADVLGIDRFIPVGYSMGGAVAQHVWRRHPRRVSGIVLCATATTFNGTTTEQLNFLSLGGLAALARLTPAPVRRSIAARYRRDRHADWTQWARDQSARSDWRAVLEAAAALGRFHSASWITRLDVPAAVVVTTEDAIVPVPRQRQLAALLPDPALFSVDAGHDAVVAAPGFATTLGAAIDAVVARAS